MGSTISEFIDSSLNSFLRHPHLLDSAFGRALSYLSAGILLGQLVCWVIHDRELVPSRITSKLFLLFGITGIFISANSVLDQLINPFNEENSIPQPYMQYIPLLLTTAIGKSWLAIIAATVVAYANPRNRTIQIVCATIILLSLALTSHANESQSWNWQIPIDFLHLSFVLAWMGSMLLTASYVFVHSGTDGTSVLKAYSNYALPIFAGAIVTGIIRVYLSAYYLGNLTAAYSLVLMVKLMIVSGVIACAYLLRLRLSNGSSGNRLLNILSLEVFLTGILILAASILTQLQPT